jgi:hypothetical protein
MQSVRNIQFSINNKADFQLFEPAFKYGMSRKLRPLITSEEVGCYIGQNLTDDEQEVCNKATD